MSLPLEEKNATPEEESAVSYLFLNNRTFVFIQLLIQMQPTLQLQTGNDLSGEEIGVRKKHLKIFEIHYLVLYLIFCFKILRTMMSFFTSIFRNQNSTGDIHTSSPPSLNVTLHHSQEVSEMSQLSTTSLVGALNSVGVDIRSSLNSFGADINQSLGKIEKCLNNLNKTLEDAVPRNSQSSLLLAENYGMSSGGSGLALGSPSIDTYPEKSVFIEFQIQQPDGLFSVCRILPPKEIVTMFGKGKRLNEPKSMSLDPLKLLLVSAWKTFITGDRVVVPELLEWDGDKAFDSTSLKDIWLGQCLKWFPTAGCHKGKCGACAIVHNGSNPVFIIFSYDFVIIDDKIVLQPKVTAYVSEKKVISGRFPWDALGQLFLELMSVNESAEGMAIGEVECKTVAFLDQPLQSLSEISSQFKLHDEDFRIDLPRDVWKVNNYSLSVYGVVMFCSKNLTGRLVLPQFNVFLDMGTNLKTAISTNDVNSVRLALCKSIYVAGLKLVRVDGAKLLTDENGNVLDDSDDIDVVVDTLDSHVLAFLSQTDGEFSIFF